MVVAGLLLMRGLTAADQLDALPPGLHPRRHRRRADQRAAGLDGGRGGAARARRHGLGHQLDAPPGRDRHRRRERSARSSPADQVGGRLAPQRHAAGRALARARDRDQRPAACAALIAGVAREDRGLLAGAAKVSYVRRAQHDPAGRRRRRVRRHGGRVHDDPPARLPRVARPQAGARARASRTKRPSRLTTGLSAACAANYAC